ncbi:unnamed protein product [Durusdinium trenchii]
MLAITVESRFAVDASAALAASALTVPWAEILHSGWPVFQLFGILSRWASPYLDFEGANVSGLHGRSIFHSVKKLESACDKAESGAMRHARELLGAHWRQLDPHVSVGELDHIEESLAELRGSSRKDEAAAYHCYWTKHPNRSLGGLAIGDIPEEPFNACAAHQVCAGISSKMLHQLQHGDPLLTESGEVSHVRWCTPLIKLHDKSLLCPFARAVGLLATAFRLLGNSSTTHSYAPELVKQANMEVAAFASGDGAGREAWASQWPLWQVLARLQLRLDLVSDPVAGSPGATVLPRLQKAVGFDDEAWRLLLNELNAVSSEASVPLPLRERVRCTSGSSCVAEFFGRLHGMLFSSEKLPLRDQIFTFNQDAILPELMLRSKRMDFNDEKELEYDWKGMVQEIKARMETGEEISYEEEIQSLVPKEHPLQVDRLQLAHFILEVRDLIVAEGPLRRCLEWDQPFLLVRAFTGLCRFIDIYSYSEPNPSEPRMGLPGRNEYKSGTIHYWGDMERPENFSVDAGSMDLILCPFIFEHVARPWKAIRTLAGALRPGGFVVWAAPMFQRYHGSPHDYYRYTPNGVKALADEAGLEVIKLYSPGDLSLVNGVLMGMLMPYWSMEHVLREAELMEKDNAPRHPLNVFALLRKPGSRPDIW